MRVTRWDTMLVADCATLNTIGEHNFTFQKFRKIVWKDINEFVTKPTVFCWWSWVLDPFSLPSREDFSAKLHWCLYLRRGCSSQKLQNHQKDTLDTWATAGSWMDFIGSTLQNNIDSNLLNHFQKVIIFNQSKIKRLSSDYKALFNEMSICPNEWMKGLKK